MSKCYSLFTASKLQRKKSFCLLIDPDKVDLNNLTDLIKLSLQAQVDAFFIGGSLMMNNQVDALIATLKRQTNIPCILFPGSPNQLSNKADAVLLLSLISGRNPDLLIGKHVESAPFLKASGLEILPTGYMLIDGGAPTSVSYMSNTIPIPSNKNDIAICTAMAGEMLGLKLIYMDAGSGALQPISNAMIHAVSSQIQVPLIVGGGITSAQVAIEKAQAGADAIVVGNAIEKDPQLILDIANGIHALNQKIYIKSS